MFFALVVLAALLTASVATATNGGFTPEQPHSPNAHHTLTAYYVILGFTAAVCVLVEGLLVVFIFKYRQRGRRRTDDGAQVHGHTRLELIWTVVPVLILTAIGIVVFVELPKIADAPAATNALHVKVEGHQYYWQFDYPNGARTINALYVPVGRVVDLDVVSEDVIHSWWIPELGGKIHLLDARARKCMLDPPTPSNAINNAMNKCAPSCRIILRISEKANRAISTAASSTMPLSPSTRCRPP